MGLDASVMCNCFREGKTKPPPFPRDWLEIGEEGVVQLKREYDTESNWPKLNDWEQSCCEHEGMDFVCERISNWAGYRTFQEALAEISWQRFPVLQEQLPNSNCGMTPAIASAEALRELDAFIAVGEIGMKSVLVNTATGEGLYEYIAAYEGVFIFSSCGINVGVSEYEFFAIDASGRDVFRAVNVRQFNKSGRQITGDSDELVWEDLDTGDIFESGIAISGKQIPWEDGTWQRADGKCRFEYPSEFHVEQQPRLVTDFDYITSALRKVFEASVRTGNPVRWF